VSYAQTQPADTLTTRKLKQFRLIANDLGGETSEKVT